MHMKKVRTCTSPNTIVNWYGVSINYLQENLFKKYFFMKVPLLLKSNVNIGLETKTIYNVDKESKILS